ncbi:MAG: YhfT family protein [Treponema sp.]|jgi:hypothetical protein|nr:YhfT family protein [Treponema sp.]
MSALQLILAASLGGLAAVLANRGVAVFNDALRPIMPEYMEGRMDKKSLAATSFALCFGLVIGFGIPFSLTTKTMLLVHSILLGTDVIGTWSPRSKTGIIVSAVIGALYGIGLVIGLQAVVDLFKLFPVDFLSNLGKVGDPIVAAFAVFPAVVVAYQYGMVKGGITLGITLVVMQIIRVYGRIPIQDATIALSAEGMGLLVGMIILIGLAIIQKPEEKTDSTAQVAALFSDRIQRIQKNIIILAVMGGLVAASTSAGILAGDPVSLQLLAEGKRFEAAIAAFARGIGFIPLVATTAIATGVYGPVGLTFVFTVGILIGNPFLAFLAGAVTIALEVLLITIIAKGLDRFPGIRDCGNQIRTVMSRVLEVSLLVGAMIAANAMAPVIGFLFVTGIYLINLKAKKPLVNMAVGPVSVIFLGILLNILHILQLFPIAAK